MLEEILKSCIGSINYSAYISSLVDLGMAALWPLTVLVLVFKFRREIAQLLKKPLRIEGPWGKFEAGETSTQSLPGAPQILERHRPTPLASSVSATIKQNDEEKAAAELAFLLSKYQYFWCAWIKDPKFSHAVRFSEKFSGGDLRYLDQYCKELTSFQNKRGQQLPKNVQEEFNKLKSFLDSVSEYHKEGQDLNAPAFSMPAYKDIFRQLLNTL